MMSCFQRPFTFPARLVALLVAAHAATFALGCEEDCAYQASRCPRVDLTAFCSGNGACTAGGQPVDCSQWKCALAPSHTLSIPLDAK